MKVPQRILNPDKALASKNFPASPRRAWRAALDIEGAKVAMSYAVGNLLTGSFSKILEKDCPTLVLWIVLPSGERIRAWWARREDWKFMSAWIVHPDVKAISHPEMMALLKKEKS